MILKPFSKGTHWLHLDIRKKCVDESSWVVNWVVILQWRQKQRVCSVWLQMSCLSFQVQNWEHNFYSNWRQIRFIFLHGEWCPNPFEYNKAWYAVSRRINIGLFCCLRGWLRVALDFDLYNLFSGVYLKIFLSVGCILSKDSLLLRKGYWGWLPLSLIWEISDGSHFKIVNV